VTIFIRAKPNKAKRRQKRLRWVSSLSGVARMDLMTTPMDSQTQKTVVHFIAGHWRHWLAFQGKKEGENTRYYAIYYQEVLGSIQGPVQWIPGPKKQWFAFFQAIGGIVGLATIKNTEKSRENDMP
jgi:hypothetical protein